MAPVKWAKEPLVGSGPKTRWFIPPSEDGWTQPVIMEWELKGEAWTDCHAHDEYAYVLEGQLFVTCDGTVVKASPGELVRVPGNMLGRYWAPEYARMLGIYAPNPSGVPMSDATFEKLNPSVSEGSFA